MERTKEPLDLVASALVTLRSASTEELRGAVDEAISELVHALGKKHSFSKTEAAALLDVTTPTVDKWARMGLLPVKRVPEFKRDRIPTGPLLDLATAIKKLRNEGRQRGLIAEALSRLEQEDPEWRKEFDELYVPALAAADVGDDLICAAPGRNWHPND